MDVVAPGSLEIILFLLIWLLPFAIAIYLIVMATRLVRAVESIAESMRRRPPQ